MKRLTKLQRRLILANIVLLFFGCVMVGLRQNTISNMGYSAWTYIKFGLFENPFNSFTNMIKDFSNLWAVYQDNEYLNQQLASQHSYQTMYEEERNKNSELEGMLQLKKSMGDAVQVSAQVISRPTQSWNQTVTISAGSASGIKENMLVVSSVGAVGQIKSVQDATSTVELLTSSDLINDLAIQISMEDGSSVEGVLHDYDAKSNRYKVTLFDHEAKVGAGMLVSTSGIGGNYPGGIFIGTVTGVEMNDNAIISTIEVQPVSNISSFNYVQVIGNGAVKK